MKLIGIDPGPKFTAYAILLDGQPIEKGRVANDELFHCFQLYNLTQCFLEKMQSFGMPVGAEVFDTAYWIGEVRYRIEAHGVPVKLVSRNEVKLHHCHSPRAKDPHIRQVMIDRFGGKEQIKRGGLLHGFKSDIWSALAIACYGFDKAQG